MTNATRSSAMLSIVSRSDVERTSSRGKLSSVTADGVVPEAVRTSTAHSDTTNSAVPPTRRSLLATVGRFLAPKAATKPGERVNADFWDQRHTS